ncbi:MAG: HTTM domain-containing protein, partial [Flavobacteriaceae bacterium]|nr:HTTM domain-containing protein [Flavobacteriaceae bacterium]
MITKYFNKYTDAKPLVVFRIFFGVMMFISMLRFWANGWVEKLYIKPTFFFSYYGFEWVKPVGNYTYLIFVACAIASLFVAIGYKYRIAIIIFFLSFTYIELMDKTTYLNHYYFVSVLSFLLIFLPANSQFSVDSYLRKKEYIRIPRWTIDSIKLLLAIVYFYAGLTKLNSDWLFRAMPLKIWLPSKYDLPLIGNNLMQQEWFHFAMSWGGALYDLIIPFLLIF